MIAVTGTSKNLSHSLNDSEKNVQRNRAELIYAANFFKRKTDMDFHEKFERFQRLNELNSRSKVNTLHISYLSYPCRQI